MIARQSERLKPTKRQRIYTGVNSSKDKTGNGAASLFEKSVYLEALCFVPSLSHAPDCI